ncbi:ferredoxin [Kineosporia sp. NBRC 101731]|uniref:ferredoxin n=1 Tax=Kineosporia sp. NBRC 101731 TaxID=3032199 RepID=UPI0024A45AFC|nr:ferredoxin [Kineosporia sp. NBRC 101731]GLY32373.1 ferredoxin [Kineosporia sp. NBRC 101731]
MRVVVDENRCIGAGQCVRWAPGHFEQDEETGLVRPVTEVVDAGGGGVDGAVKACPSGAIRFQS